MLESRKNSKTEKCLKNRRIPSVQWLFVGQARRTPDLLAEKNHTAKMIRFYP
jgi:hypothetical protein